MSRKSGENSVISIHEFYINLSSFSSIVICNTFMPSSTPAFSFVCLFVYLLTLLLL